MFEFVTVQIEKYPTVDGVHMSHETGLKFCEQELKKYLN